MVENLRIGVAVKHGVDVTMARADATSKLVDLATAPRKTSDFDRNAVEEAVRLREKHGGTVTALSVGGPASRSALRDALAIGADEAVLITDEMWAAWDTRAASRLLASAVRALGGFDLLLVGEGSTDHFAGLIGPRVAAELGLPDIAYVRRLTIEGNGVIAEKELEKEIEVVRASFPVVLSVGQEINTPRIPGFMAILKASKKEARVFRPAELQLTAHDLAASILVDRVAVPDVVRKLVSLTEGSPEEVAVRLRELLRTEGVLP